MISVEIRLRQEAIYDVDEIFLRYERDVKGLGFRFLEFYDQAISKIRSNPHHAFNVSEYVRRLVIKKFPYVIYYIIEPDHIVVLAVLHQSRNPAVLKKRI